MTMLLIMLTALMTHGKEQFWPSQRFENIKDFIIIFFRAFSLGTYNLDEVLYFTEMNRTSSRSTSVPTLF